MHVSRVRVCRSRSCPPSSPRTPGSRVTPPPHGPTSNRAHCVLCTGCAPAPLVSVWASADVSLGGTAGSGAARRAVRLRQSVAGCSSVRPHHRTGSRRRVTSRRRPTPRQSRRPARAHAGYAPHRCFTSHQPRRAPRCPPCSPSGPPAIQRADHRRPGAARDTGDVVSRAARVS